MRTSEFDYYLPPGRIAQVPVEPRHSSRLMVLNREKGEVEHRTFWDLDQYFAEGDLLVVNRTRVIPARIFGKKKTGGKVEILLLSKIDDLSWKVLIGAKGMKTGQEIFIANAPTARIITELEGAERILAFENPIEPFLLQIGKMPLPPYIHTQLDRPERYQTVYARESGSAAAPTAGLHFTPELISKLKGKGINFTEVLLHVGLDTFVPVTENDPAMHKIHSEWCSISAEAAVHVNETKLRGKKVIAIGTTSVRTLESAARNVDKGQVIGAFTGQTSLFILPGFQFQVTDAMVTNFHLPRSTLLMLVSAFTGRERILAAYRQAIEMNYRFYSFGDAMLIL